LETIPAQVQLREFLQPRHRVGQHAQFVLVEGNLFEVLQVAEARRESLQVVLEEARHAQLLQTREPVRQRPQRRRAAETEEFQILQRADVVGQIADVPEIQRHQVLQLVDEPGQSAEVEEINVQRPQAGLGGERVHGFQLQVLVQRQVLQPGE